MQFVIGDGSQMNTKITFRQVVDRLKEYELPYAVLTLQKDVTVVITQRGGHILGPFLYQEGESIFWINKDFANAASFKDFLDSGTWNLGGDRIWIAPEIQYSVHDRTDFWGSIQLPEQIDPGHYSLDQSKPNEWRLIQDLTLQAYNLASGQKQLHLERVIRPVEDPLRNLSHYQDLMRGVLFAGYEQVVTLSEGQLDDIMSESWSSIQLNPGGLLLIPASPHLEYSDYFEPIDENYQTIYPNHVRVKITGHRRYKVGYKAAHVFGRLAYFNHLDDERACLIVRNFFNNPSMPYVEEPPDKPGRRGHSIHVYNDDGNFGGFGELECNGQTIGSVTGRSSSTDQMVMWLYVGSTDRVRKLLPHLLGIEL
jgi:hypothetical protein